MQKNVSVWLDVLLVRRISSRFYFFLDLRSRDISFMVREKETKLLLEDIARKIILVCSFYGFVMKGEVRQVLMKRRSKKFNR